MVEKRVEENLRTSQMADDALNVDFLNWLKKWGPNLIILVALVVIAFQLSTWWTQRTEDRQSQAWADLSDTTTVVGLQKVASENAGIGSIAELAWLNAADLHYVTILKDEALEEDALPGEALIGGDDEPLTDTGNAEAEDPEAEETVEDDGPKRLSAADRADILNKMERLYQQVLDSTAGDPDRDLLQLRAIFGQATVAEMRLDNDAAKGWYEQAAKLSGDTYPKYTKLAAVRITDLATANVKFEILTQDELNQLEEAKRVPELLQRPAEATVEDGSGAEDAASSNDEADNKEGAGDESNPKAESPGEGGGI